jgi:exopolyphosphatase/guanosine-5'-triphosphate,3'-diphosphate pyrophosphatase
MLPHKQRDSVGDFERQVLASAAILAAKYRCELPHSRHVAHLAVRLFDELAIDHGLEARDRLRLEVAALLHDAGNYISRRAHHKHSQYILSMSEVFGLTAEDMMVIGNVARYHRRGLPQKSHVFYMSLDRETRVSVNKLAAILRVANALDADHLQNVKDLRVLRESDGWVLEVSGAGDLTMGRHAMTARSDMLVEVFGQELSFREMAESP